MSNDSHILISLDERHAIKIFTGDKTVELRRRLMKVESGTTVWIYVKKPIGAVAGNARINSTHYLRPSTLWKRFSHVSGLTKDEFFSYFSSASKGFALSLTDVKRLSAPISLEQLRKTIPGFHPPQFFMHVQAKNSVFGRAERKQ